MRARRVVRVQKQRHVPESAAAFRRWVCAAAPLSCRRKAAFFSERAATLLDTACAVRPAGSKTVPHSETRRRISAGHSAHAGNKAAPNIPRRFSVCPVCDAFRYRSCGTSCGFKKQCRIPKLVAAFQRGMARTLATKLRQTSSDGFPYARSAALPSHTSTSRPANSSTKRRPPFRKPPRFLQAFGGRAPSGRACAAKITAPSARFSRPARSALFQGTRSRGRCARRPRRRIRPPR